MPEPALTRYRQERNVLVNTSTGLAAARNAEVYLAAEVEARDADTNFRLFEVNQQLEHAAAEVARLTRERDDARVALERAGDAIHSEYCGRDAHHPECQAVLDALAASERTS